MNLCEECKNINNFNDCCHISCNIFLFEPTTRQTFSPILKKLEIGICITWNDIYIYMIPS